MCRIFVLKQSYCKIRLSVVIKLICLNYSFEAGNGNQANGSGVGPILSVVSVVLSEICRGLVVQSGDWSAERTGYIGKSGI